MSEVDLCRKCPRRWPFLCWGSLEVCWALSRLWQEERSSSAALESDWQAWTRAKRQQKQHWNALICFNPSGYRMISFHYQIDKLRARLQSRPAWWGICDSLIIAWMSSPGSPPRLDAPAGHSHPSVTLGCASAVWQLPLTFGTPAPGSWARDSALLLPPRQGPAQIIEQGNVTS